MWKSSGYDAAETATGHGRLWRYFHNLDWSVFTHGLFTGVIMHPKCLHFSFYFIFLLCRRLTEPAPSPASAAPAVV